MYWSFIEMSEFMVLIETLWNVKKANGGIVIGTKGINRNIVECKDNK